MSEPVYNSMGKRLTKEQIDHRNKILGKKLKPKKVKTLYSPAKQPSKIDYMNNCMFWVNEYNHGRGDIEILKKAAFHLKQYCEEILNQ